MNYAPKGLLVWDAWYMPVGNRVHVYHLQRRRAGTDVPEFVHDSLGHAVTANLVDWETRPPAFGPDPANPLDDCQPWTDPNVRPQLSARRQGRAGQIPER